MYNVLPVLQPSWKNATVKTVKMLLLKPISWLNVNDLTIQSEKLNGLTSHYICYTVKCMVLQVIYVLLLYNL